MKCPCQNDEEMDILLDYSVGRLDAARSALLERHMNECAECGALGLGQREVWSALDDFTAPAPGMDFNRGVWRKIEATAAEPWYSAMVRSLREGAWKPALPLAAAVL